MARNELIAKSVSRLTFTLQDDQKLAKTTRGILTGSRYDSYSQAEKELIEQAVSEYENYGHNIYITEGVGNVGIDIIREKIQKHIKITGKAPVGISSFNRDNYSAPVNLASFKESGAIEYSSDVLIGLQYEGMDYQEGENEKARDKRIRELVKEQAQAGKQGKAQKLQVKVLKNRNGCKGSIAIDFYPMFNYFTEQYDSGEEYTDEWTSISSTRL